MRLIRFTLLGLVCALVLASPALADCKRCSGQYCPSVSDLALGHDHCDMSSSMQTTWGTNGVTISWVTTCTPAGEECTNDHTSITVSDGGGKAGDFGSIQTLNQLACYMGWGSYFDCG